MTKLTLPPLPYDYDALEPNLSKQIVEARVSDVGGQQSTLLQGHVASSAIRDWCVTQGTSVARLTPTNISTNAAPVDTRGLAHHVMQQAHIRDVGKGCRTWRRPLEEGLGVTTTLMELDFNAIVCAGGEVEGPSVGSHKCTIEVQVAVVIANHIEFVDATRCGAKESGPND